jgi:hypothetical protein
MGAQLGKLLTHTRLSHPYGLPRPDVGKAKAESVKWTLQERTDEVEIWVPTRDEDFVTRCTIFEFKTAIQQPQTTAGQPCRQSQYESLAADSIRV